MQRKINEPIIDFLNFFIHLHSLNLFLINSVSRYEKLAKTMKDARKLINEIKQVEPDENEYEDNQEKLQETIRKEINENFYTLKTSEIILIYSRLESAISEIAYIYFENTDYKKINHIENIKVNAISLIKLSKREQLSFLAEQYIINNTQSIKYGFNRFEAILKPLLGQSQLSKKHQDSIFRFAQVRNLLIHKNGIIDKQFKLLFKSPKYKLNQKINIDKEIIKEFYDCTIAYSKDIIERIKLIKNDR